MKVPRDTRSLPMIFACDQCSTLSTDITDPCLGCDLKRQITMLVEHNEHVMVSLHKLLDVVELQDKALTVLTRSMADIYVQVGRLVACADGD